MSKKDIIGATISFNAELVYEHRGNEWSGIPKDMAEFFEKPEGSMSGITDRLEPAKYAVTVSITRR